MTGSYDPKSLTYEVEFSGSKIKDCSTNVVAENVCFQVDEDGRNTQILDFIVDCRKDSNAVDKANVCLRINSG